LITGGVNFTVGFTGGGGSAGGGGGGGLCGSMGGGSASVTVVVTTIGFVFSFGFIIPAIAGMAIARTTAPIPIIAALRIRFGYFLRNS
ncbi:MAG TPA: hypothetical protein VN721_14950, partial [Flavipsychrobacter sp.]|nr:hypothetical protein [Flavipsychrobacter sp.]